MNRTLIGYSSNREDPKLEQLAIETMRASVGDMPIVSVTQKPMDLGENVCVGDVGKSEINCRKQLLMAAKMAKTEYVVSFETDILYPPEYFTFVPTVEKMYRYHNNWLMWLYDEEKKNFYHKQDSFDGAQILRRDFLIFLLERFLAPYPHWQPVELPRKQRPDSNPYSNQNRSYFPSVLPLVHIKSGVSMHNTTTMDDDPAHAQESLPHWGSAESIRAKLL